MIECTQRALVAFRTMQSVRDSTMGGLPIHKAIHALLGISLAIVSVFASRMVRLELISSPGRKKTKYHIETIGYDTESNSLNHIFRLVP